MSSLPFMIQANSLVSNRPKCEDLVVAQVSPRKMSGHTNFLDDNLLHTVSKL